MAAGAVAGYLLESLPFTPFRASPSVQTALAAVAGLFAARLVARGLSGWGRGLARDVAEGHARADARLVHPLLGAGLWISGTAVLWSLVCARHETLEFLATPRDPETLVVRGAEEIATPGDPELSHAVLLVHGYSGSPADFGDLPERLRARGLAVRAVRLPGHGTIPSSLDEVAPRDYAKCVTDARAALEAGHRSVSVVGFSFGAALAYAECAERPPARMVLVNPWLGDTATPSWSPVETDTLLPIAAKVTRRAIRPAGWTRVNDPAGRARQRAYATISLHGSVVARDLAFESAHADGREPPPSCPTLVLLSRGDRSVPSAAAAAWCAERTTAGSDGVAWFEESDHLLFLDRDADAAIARVVGFLTSSR
jgi:carboxylesterase